jgi:hypothetical protein
LSGRVLPNLTKARVPIRASADHFGLEPKAWWLFFRRDLQKLGVYRMSEPQWMRALQIAAHRTLRPYKAARQIAVLPSKQEMRKAA